MMRNLMIRASLSLAMLPLAFTTIAGCTAPATVKPSFAPTPAAVIFGTCPQRPVWPEAARQENRQGTVGLAFYISDDSAVLESRIKRSSGHADLDEAARVGIAKCKFKAATRNGKPIPGWAELDYVWAP
jgi:TonB family protein